MPSISMVCNYNGVRFFFYRKEWCVCVLVCMCGSPPKRKYLRAQPAVTSSLTEWTNRTIIIFVVRNNYYCDKIADCSLYIIKVAVLKWQEKRSKSSQRRLSQKHFITGFTNGTRRLIWQNFAVFCIKGDWNKTYFTKSSRGKTYNNLKVEN